MRRTGATRSMLLAALLLGTAASTAAQSAVGAVPSPGPSPNEAARAPGAAGPAGASGGAFVHPQLLVSAEALRRELGTPGLLIVDARAPSAYRAGHLPGAVNVPAHSLDRSVTLSSGAVVPSIVMSADEITPLLDTAGIRSGSNVVIYAQGFDPEATRLFWVLDYYGKRRVALLDGGLEAWVAAGGPTDRSPVTPRVGDFVAVPDPAKVADFDWVRSHLGDASTEVCDALSSQSFAAGSIPGSINLPAFESFRIGPPLEQLGGWLAEVMRERHLSRDSDVVFYCGTGYVSSMDYFVARLMGFDHVRLYDGSLVDWQARGGALAPGRS